MSSKINALSLCYNKNSQALAYISINYFPLLFFVLALDSDKPFKGLLLL